MHKKLLYISVILSLLLLGGCNTLKQSRKPKEPKPEWVDNRPSSGMYYIGIGSANTAGLPPDAYKENARNKALNALSSEISVNISSSSVISTIETDYQLSETYSRQIKSSSDRNIEGYEIVDEWDGGDYYWIYYRLSKSEYQAQKARKKNAALQQAKTKYVQAGELRSEGKQYEAVSSYVEAFADLTEYLAEPTEVYIDSSKIDLGSSIYRDLIQSLNEIQFSSKQNPLSVTSGINISPEFLEIQLKNKEGKVIPNMPVCLSFTTGGLMDNKMTTDQDGILHIPIDKVSSTKQVETLTVEIDMTKLSRLTKDIFIRTVIKKIPPPTYKLVFNVMSPMMFLESSESALGEKSDDYLMRNAMYEAMAKNNLRLAKSPSGADFIIRIESESRKGESSSYQQAVVVSYSISVLDKNNRIVYRKDESGITGYGDNVREANKEAYDEAVNRLKRKSAPAAFKVLFK